MDLVGVIGTLAAIVAVPLTWVIAKKQGIFNRTDVRASLYDLVASGKTRPELVIGGPYLNSNVLTPVLVKIANYGKATAYDVEVNIESNSSLVVNHPNFFISPAATGSAEAIEGSVTFLGNNVFRRVFKLTQLNPGKSVQLNNAGLPRNILSEGQPVANSTLSITIYERGKRAKKSEFRVWSLDTTTSSFSDALRKMAEKTKLSYRSLSPFRRFMGRILSFRSEHPLRLMEITELREVVIPGETQPFSTIEKMNISYGVRLVTGWLFVGAMGFI